MRRLVFIGVLALLGNRVEADVAAPGEAARGRGGFRVTGRVTWRGKVPRIGAIDSKYIDPKCPANPSSRRLLIGNEGGVANTYVYLADMHGWAPTEGWGGSRKTMTEQVRGALVHDQCDFSPHLQVVPPGAVILNGNLDGTLHNTHAHAGGSSLFNLALISQTKPLDRRVDALGRIEVRCDVHPWESGYVIVSDRPYYAVTGLDGTFAIENVPIGKWKIVAWHEGWERSHQTVTNPLDLTGPVEMEKSVSVGTNVLPRVDFEIGE